MDFGSLLEKKGIPEYLFKPASQSQSQELKTAATMISKICQIYPAHEKTLPSVGEFFISITCKSFQSLPEVAQQAWGLLHILKTHMKNSKELLIFYNFLNEAWPLDLFLFYLRCRKTIVQIKLGDNFKGESDLQVLGLNQTEWVSVAVKMFTGLLKPTSIVPKITKRLLDFDFIDEVPGNVLLVQIVEEYSESLKKPVINGNKVPVARPKPPPRKENNGFDLMKYGKHVTGPKKPSTRENSFYMDEELHSATVEASPPSTEKPVFYRISSSFESHSEELHRLRDELERTVMEKDRLKEALEETVEFCDSLSYEHDLLLIQNSKLKKLLSIVTDKLIRIDQDSINEIDFTDVLDDPCVDFKPTGILKEKKNGKGDKNRQQYLDLPFSENAGRDVGKKKVPATPKFSAPSTELEVDVLICSEDYLPSQAGLLNMNKGDKIKKISELDDWFFGENLENGTRGFFPPASISYQDNGTRGFFTPARVS